MSDLTFRHRARFLAILVAMLVSASPALADCIEPRTGSSAVPVFSPPLSEVVIGSGRLQFYSAPNAGCAIKGVFVIPRDQLIAYAESDDGWTSVMYLNGRTGVDVSGWVRSARLRPTGTVGPKY